MEHIKAIYDHILSEPFPSEGGKEVSGIDLVLIDADTMGIVSKFFGSKGHLKQDDKKKLQSCYDELKIVVRNLDKVERQYFASLKQLANEMLEFTNGDKLKGNEIESRHKWKKVYDQIKIVVNELDPLGVADMFDGEYDDLNFRIYSQLLDSRDEKKLFDTIKLFVRKDYGIELPDNAIKNAIEKLINIAT